MDQKNKFIVNFYYLCRYLYLSKFKILAIPLFACYRFIVYWLLGTDLHYKTQIGRDMTIFHGVGLVINPESRIGSGLIVRHNVTIGNYIHNGAVTKSPRLGNNVEIGCGAVILGDIDIGDNVLIAANAIVTKDIPSNFKCYGYNVSKNRKFI